MTKYIDLDLKSLSQNLRPTAHTHTLNRGFASMFIAV